MYICMYFELDRMKIGLSFFLFSFGLLFWYKGKWSVEWRLLLCEGEKGNKKRSLAHEWEKEKRRERERKKRETERETVRVGKAPTRGKLTHTSFSLSLSLSLSHTHTHTHTHTHILCLPLHRISTRFFAWYQSGLVARSSPSACDVSYADDQEPAHRYRSFAT